MGIHGSRLRDLGPDGSELSSTHVKPAVWKGFLRVVPNSMIHRPLVTLYWRCVSHGACFVSGFQALCWSPCVKVGSDACGRLC